MSEEQQLPKLIAKQRLEEIDRWIAKYPPEFKCSAVMATLSIVQDELGHLTRETMDAVAHYLEMEPISVYEVATFYSMYELEPVGRHKICVCTNISCMLCGSDQVVSHIGKKLGIGLGETTADRMFTLKEVECLGACGGAPMMQVDKTYYENLTPEKIDDILDQLRREAKTETSATGA